MKKFIALFFAMLVLFVCPLFAFAEETDDDMNGDVYTAYGNLITAWAEQGLPMYPDYVGGVYFSEEGQLIVALSDDTDAYRSEIRTLSGAPEIVQFKSVKFSYNDLQKIVEEITYNCDSNSYDFLVNFANIIEEENIVEIRVGSSELPVAENYFRSLYGDKVVVSGGYDTVSDTDFEEIDDSDSRIEKIRSTKNLRMYISIGVIAVLLIAVLVVTFLSQKKPASSQRRYRK